MAVSAYIFVEVTQGKALEIRDQISAINGVMEAHSVTGPYDIIARVEGDDVGVLGEFIVSRIQNVPGVQRTLTNIIVE
ncbi:MAG: Lrp/AsnC ligand binding domain-containing protein [Chlamydiota bacterium]